MATTIQLKRNAIASTVPLASELEQGELAVNLADRKLYTKDATNSVVQILGNTGDPGEGLYIPLVGTSPGNHVTGDVTWVNGTQEWSIGVLEGVFDDYLSIGAGSANTGTTGVNIIGNDAGGSGVNNYFFRGDGVALFPELIIDPNGTTSDNLGFSLTVVGTAAITACYVETVTESGTLRVLNDAHIGSTDGPGAYTLAVTGDTNLIGNMVCQGGITAVGEVFGVGNIGSTEGQVIIGANSPSATNHATRKDYVDNNFVKKTGGTFTGVVSMTSTGGNNITNLRVDNFLTLSAAAGTGTRNLVVASNGVVTTQALSAADIEVSPGITLADWVGAVSAEILALGGSI